MSSQEVKLNLLGIDLTKDQVDSVVTAKSTNKDDFFWKKKRHLVAFFRLENDSELTRNLLTRYAEADEAMTRISIGSNDDDIRARLMDTLASAKRCYSHTEYLACIELCALHAEMLANFLCITEREKLEVVFPNLPEEAQKAINDNKGDGIYFSDTFPQGVRLKWLTTANILSRDNKRRLFTIHDQRKKYFHHWSTKRGNEKQDAILALSVISPVTSHYLETLKVDNIDQRTDIINRVNLVRIDRYMSIVLENSK